MCLVRIWWCSRPLYNKLHIYFGNRKGFVLLVFLVLLAKMNGAISGLDRHYDTTTLHYEKMKMEMLVCCNISTLSTFKVNIVWNLFVYSWNKEYKIFLQFTWCVNNQSIVHIYNSKYLYLSLQGYWHWLYQRPKTITLTLEWT